MTSSDTASTGIRPRVDCHTHLGLAGTHLCDEAIADLVHVIGRPLWNVQPDDHRSEASTAGRSIVLAFDAPDIGIVVPDEYVAGHVANDDTMIGFASVDPKRSDAVPRLERAVTELGLQGLKVGPVYQHFHPHSVQAFDLMEAAQGLGIPVVWHFGATFVRDVPMEYGNPILLDAVARKFPDLRMWIAHLGVPWYTDAMAVMRRHPHIYADVSAAHSRPFQFYLAMASAVDHRMTGRLLFGSDYPFSTIDETIDALMTVNRWAHGTGLPTVPQEDLVEIIERNTLALLGIAEQGTPREA